MVKFRPAPDVLRMMNGPEWGPGGTELVNVCVVVGFLLVLGRLGGQVHAAWVWAGGSQAYLWPSGTGSDVPAT